MNKWINRFAFVLEKFIMLFVTPIIWLANGLLPQLDKLIRVSTPYINSSAEAFSSALSFVLIPPLLFLAKVLETVLIPPLLLLAKVLEKGLIPALMFFAKLLEKALVPPLTMFAKLLEKVLVPPMLIFANLLNSSINYALSIPAKMKKVFTFK